MQLQEELTRFLQPQPGRRASTTQTYATILVQFVESAKVLSEAKDLPVAVSDFLSAKNLKPATHNLYLSTITTFLFDRRLITREDRDDLHRKRVQIVQQPYLEHALSEVELLNFFLYLRKHNARTNRMRQQRDLCIFLLQYACALRISEALTLTSEDVTYDTGAIMVRIRAENSKTGLERTVPMRYDFSIAGIQAVPELNVWLAMRRQVKDQLETPYLFFTLRASTFGRAVNPDRMIEKYDCVKVRLGITSGRATHALRHTRITQLANNPLIPMPMISEFAGHHSKGQPNIRTTSLYIQRPKPGEITKFL